MEHEQKVVTPYILGRREYLVVIPQFLIVYGTKECKRLFGMVECKTKALFSSEKISNFGTVAFSFLFDKYYLIMDELGSKDSSHDLQTNCAISFYFRIYLMFHVLQDLMWREILKSFWFSGWTKQGLRKRTKKTLIENESRLKKHNIDKNWSFIEMSVWNTTI